MRGLTLTTMILGAALALVPLGGLHAQDAAAPAEPAAAVEVEAEGEMVAEEAPAAEEPAAEEAPLDAAMVGYAVDNLLLFLCAVLVLLMQAGFAMVEAGLVQAKHATNVLFKNTIDFCLGVLMFYFIGYGLMYPGDAYEGKYFGYTYKNFEAPVTDAGPGTLNPQVDFLFQAVFCATAATIVSGCVAGRMKFIGYLVYTIALTGFIYPIGGMWKWGGGWLGAMDFYDFAGSIVVHACGGFAGLAGAIALGPRIGRYNAEGKSVPIPGHNLAYATLGVFILLFGWYGFNPGSQLAFVGQSNTDVVMLIATNTTLAAAAGGLLGMIVSWGMFGKPDLTMALNGILAGLVGITANCDSVTNMEAIIIGIVAGVLVVLAVVALDKLKIDDPVGAFPVHGVCGVWGGLATGIFGGHPMQAQIIGSIAIPVFSFVTMFILFMILKAVGLLRVSPEEEMRGLDIVEHGMSCYGVDQA